MGHFHCSRFVPHQDPNKASNQGGSEGHVWQGGQSQGKASQDCCEGFPSGCIEESDLEERDSVVLYAFSEVLPWESHGAGLRHALLGSLFATVHLPAQGPPLRRASNNPHLSTTQPCRKRLWMLHPSPC